MNIQECVLAYQTTKKEIFLEEILNKLSDTINYYIYQKTNYHDKQELYSIAQLTLLKCVNTYDQSKNTQFTTYFSKCLHNSIKLIIRDNKKHLDVLSLDYDYDNNEDEDSTMYNYITDDNSEICYNDVETNLLLEQIKCYLNPNEFQLCELILKENHILGKAELASALDITIPGVTYLLNNIKKKICKYITE